MRASTAPRAQAAEAFTSPTAITSHSLGQEHLVLPVKRLATAKTRHSTDATTRRAAAELLLARTLRIATSCLNPSQIWVVTADETVVRQAQALGVGVLPERSTNLNSALHAAVDELKHSNTKATVVVLAADLPRLQEAELCEALSDAAGSGLPRHVADHHGTGTTLVSIPPGSHIPMVFGDGSAQRFTKLGLIPMTHAPRGLRTDLDTPSGPFQLDCHIQGDQL